MKLKELREVNSILSELWDFFTSNSDCANEGMIRGNMSIYHSETHTVCFFKGSPHDKRLGTVSLFFTNQIIPGDEFLAHLKTIKFFNELVELILK